MKLSAIIIAKNEEKKIVDCLSSVAFCDEILVIDSGSADRTVQLAKAHHAKVFSSTEESFAELRNEGLRKASGEWVLYIDADERVPEELQKEILTEIDSSFHDAYLLRRKNYYFHTVEWPYIEQMERLFRREKLTEWYGDLHESPRVDGTVGMLANFLVHYTHDDLASMIEKTNKWSAIEADTRYKAHHPKMTWWRFPRVMISAFWNSYVTQQGWKVGTAGLIESIFQAFSIFITYAKLWELQQKKREK